MLNSLQRLLFSAPPTFKEHLAGCVTIRQDSLPPIDLTLNVHNVTIVGAKRDTHSNDLCYRDRHWASYGLDACRQAGFSLAEGFRVTAINMLEGQDFLTPRFSSVPTDLLILAFIHNGKKVAGHDRDDSGYTVSPHCHEPLIWPASAQRSGAKIICVFSQPQLTAEEVTAQDFLGGTYVKYGDDHIVWARKRPLARFWEYKMETLVHHAIAPQLMPA